MNRFLFLALFCLYTLSLDAIHVFNKNPPLQQEEEAQEESLPEGEDAESLFQRAILLFDRGDFIESGATFKLFVERYPCHPFAKEAILNFYHAKSSLLAYRFQLGVERYRFCQ